MMFSDNPEARLIRRTIQTNGRELKDAIHLQPKDFKDPHLADIWQKILDTQKPNWNAHLELFTVEVKKSLSSKAWEDLTVIAGYEVDEFAPTVFLVSETKETQKQVLKQSLQYNLESKQELSPADLQWIRKTLDEIEKPVSLERESTPLEDKMIWINSLLTPKKIIRTNYPSIDELIGGFRKSSLYVLAARTGNGKTAVALNLARNTKDAEVVFYSLEMSNELIQERLSIIETGERQTQDDEQITPEEVERLATTYAVEDLDRIKFAEIKSGGLNIEELKADIKRRTLFGKCDLVFIDQLSCIAKTGKFINETERLAYYSTQLRQLARDLDLPIVLIAQINREGNDEPHLVHLKQTGQIEEDAAVVMLLQIKDPDAEESQLVFKVAKNRYGRTGKTFLVWKGKRMRIEDTNRQYAKPQSPAYNPATEAAKSYLPAGTAF
jgi:replicative DNA helicase